METPGRTALRIRAAGLLSRSSSASDRDHVRDFIGRKVAPQLAHRAEDDDPHRALPRPNGESDTGHREASEGARINRRALAHPELSVTTPTLNGCGDHL